jgi:hypothetical protein
MDMPRCALPCARLQLHAAPPGPTVGLQKRHGGWRCGGRGAQQEVRTSLCFSTRFLTVDSCGAASLKLVLTRLCAISLCLARPDVLAQSRPPPRGTRRTSRPRHTRTRVAKRTRTAPPAARGARAKTRARTQRRWWRKRLSMPSRNPRLAKRRRLWRRLHRPQRPPRLRPRRRSLRPLHSRQRPLRHPPLRLGSFRPRRRRTALACARCAGPSAADSSVALTVTVLCRRSRRPSHRPLTWFLWKRPSTGPRHSLASRSQALTSLTGAAARWRTSLTTPPRRWVCCTARSFTAAAVTAAWVHARAQSAPSASTRSSAGSTQRSPRSWPPPSPN